MIKRKTASVLIVAIAMMIFVSHGLAAEGNGAPWFIPICPDLALQAGALSGVDDIESAKEAIAHAASALSLTECRCDDALGFAVFFIEEAIRRGATLDAPAGGVFYTDLLLVAADMAQSVSGSALSVLADEGISLARPFGVNINFVSGQDVVDISFPGMLGMDFDNITVEAEFAAITLHQGVISGSALRIERGTPVATGGGYVAAPDTRGISGFELSYLLDFWAVAAFVVIMVIWGVLASMGKKLRLWVVPTFAVIVIAANIWTLGLQERPDAINAPAPVYFYSVIVAMPPDMNAVLSVPLGGVSPDMLMLVNEYGEPMFSRYNPLTGAIDARIYAGGEYFVRVVDVRG